MVKGMVKGKSRARSRARSRANRGKIEGKRETLVRLFMRAGIGLTDAERARIDACMDAEILDRSIDKVFGAKTAAEGTHLISPVHVTTNSSRSVRGDSLVHRGCSGGPGGVHAE